MDIDYLIGQIRAMICIEESIACAVDRMTNIHVLLHFGIEGTEIQVMVSVPGKKNISIIPSHLRNQRDNWWYIATGYVNGHITIIKSVGGTLKSIFAICKIREYCFTGSIRFSRYIVSFTWQLYGCSADSTCFICYHKGYSNAFGFRNTFRYGFRCCVFLSDYRRLILACWCFAVFISLTTGSQWGGHYGEHYRQFFSLHLHISSHLWKSLQDYKFYYMCCQ